MMKFWDDIKHKLPVNTWQGIATIIVVVLLAGVDQINQIYGTAFHVPEWAFIVLSVFGVTVKGKHPVPPSQ